MTISFMERHDVVPGARALLRITLLCIAAASSSLACSRPAPPASSPPSELRLGYFPNITHRQALIGVQRGDFQKSLGTKTKLVPTAFNAGPSVIEALFARRIDIAYIGPSPAINGWIKSEGQALHIVAGACSGGASLVMAKAKAGSFPDGLSGLRLASPQLGNTQDVALRMFLQDRQLFPKQKGGTMEIIPMENPTILGALQKGEIDGAWVPEPWASRLVLEAGAVRVLDERSIWEGGAFPTAVVIVSSDFLALHRVSVAAFVRSHVAITRWELANPEEAKAFVNEGIKALTGKPIARPVLDEAWSTFSPEWRIQEKALGKSARDAWELGFLRSEPKLENLVDPFLLQDALAEAEVK